jgi:hypothetical protein
MLDYFGADRKAGDNTAKVIDRANRANDNMNKGQEGSAMKTNIYIPSGLVVYLVVTGLLHATAQAKATRQADALLFGPTITVRWLLIALVLGFACGSLYVSLTPPQSLLGAAIFGLISMAGTLAFPANSLVTETGVAEVKWWGTQKTILWRDVDRIEYHKGPATTVVVSKAGTKVVHSGWNRDTSGFLESCEEKTGLPATTT